MSAGSLESSVEATREPNFLLAKPEKRLLTLRSRARLPRWILPDDLTALGVPPRSASASRTSSPTTDRTWLWVASACWSSSGSATRSTARSRACAASSGRRTATTSTTSSTRSRRPRSGSASGLSPSCCSRSATLIVVAYLMLSINVYLESYALRPLLDRVRAHRADRDSRRPDRPEHRARARRRPRLPVADLDLTVFDVIGLAIAGA